MPAAQIDIPAKQRIFRLPLRIYDISAGGYRIQILYVCGSKTATGTWAGRMVSAPAGYRLAGSSECYHSREGVLARHGEDAEKDFVEGPLEWTRTALDFDNGEILEDIELRKDVPLDEIRENPRLAIVSARKLGSKEGIELPHQSGYVNQMHQKYMPAVRQIWGVQNPETELPDYTYLFVEPSGFRPVARGWSWRSRVDGQAADAYFGPAGRWLAARLVREAKPEGLYTLEDYAELVQRVSDKDAELRAAIERELKPLKDRLDSAVVLLE